MGEIRVDPLSGLRVLFAPDRAQPDGAAVGGRRPEPQGELDEAEDPFAAGHEDRTPPELARTLGDGSDLWAARAFEDASPALTPDAEEPPREASLDLFTAAAARGHHEVIVSAPTPVSALTELTPVQLARAMGLWRERMAAHPQAAHVHLSVDEQAGGGRRVHSHAQLYALDFVPAAVARERERCAAYATRTQGSDLLEDLAQAEVRRRTRLVAYDDEAVLLSPYASRVPFQLMLAPRAPTPRFGSSGVLGAALLHRGLRALATRFGTPPPMTLWVRTAPRGAERFCWRIDVLPRLQPPGGLELGTGLPVNAVMPERATVELRAALTD